MSPIPYNYRCGWCGEVVSGDENAPLSIYVMCRGCFERQLGTLDESDNDELEDIARDEYDPGGKG